MLGRVSLGLLVGLGVAVLSLGAWAEEPKGPAAGNPEAIFNRLDKNHDGVITADEIPAGAPEPLKAWLQKADKNGDKKLTLDEVKEAFKAGPPSVPRAEGERPRRVGPDAARPRPQDRASAGPQRPQQPRPERTPVPDSKVLFEQMDKNHDGSLSLDEFAVGMKEFHRRLGERPGLASAGQPGRAGPDMGRPDMVGPPDAGWRGHPWHMGQAWGPLPWFHPGPPWMFAASWQTGQRFGERSPDWRPHHSQMPGQVGGPGDEHLRRLVAAMVREELQKILKEKSEAGHSQTPHRDSRGEPKK